MDVAATSQQKRHPSQIVVVVKPTPIPLAVRTSPSAEAPGQKFKAARCALEPDARKMAWNTLAQNGPRVARLEPKWLRRVAVVVVVVVVVQTQCLTRVFVHTRQPLATDLWEPCSCGHAPPVLCLCTGAQKRLPINLGDKHEALHVQDEERMRQACVGAHVDSGTLSPALNAHTITARASGTACNSGEIHV